MKLTQVYYYRCECLLTRAQDLQFGQELPAFAKAHKNGIKQTVILCLHFVDVHHYVCDWLGLNISIIQDYNLNT